MALRSNEKAKSNMLEALQFDKLEAFRANGTTVSQAEVTASFTVTNGQMTLDGSVSIEILSDRTVAYVQAVDSEGIGEPSIQIDLDVPEEFPNGGNLIVEEFTVNLGDV